MSPVLAPAGWGFRPGALLTTDDATVLSLLPELPLLRALADGAARNRAILQAVAASPARSHVAPRHLRRRYGVPAATAHDIVQRIKRA